MHMNNRDFFRLILALSLPTAFQKVVSLIVVMADNLMVSKIDPNGIAFAAVSQANIITNLFIATLMGLAGGSIVLIAQYWGKRDSEKIKNIYTTAFALCIAVTFLFFLLIQFFPYQILSVVLSNREPAVLSSAAQYLQIASISYIPFAVSTVFIALLKGVEIVKFTLLTTFLALISNITLNYILIFGKLGIPSLGIKGAAIATVLSRIIESAFITVYFFRIQRKIQIKPKDFTTFKKWAITDYFKFALPVALTDTQWAVVGLLKMSIIGHLGKTVINSVAVTDMMMNLGTLFTFSLASGAAVIVGKAAGQKNYSLVHEYSKRIQLLFLFFGILMAGSVYALRIPFISMYSLNPDSYLLAEQMVSICALTLIGTTYHASCFIGINRGAGDSRFVMKTDMVFGWLIVLPISYLSAFVFKLPPAFIYFATRIDQCFKWIVAFLRLRGNKWIHNVTR